jgi:Arc/MetJ-type ribon-helix-helix transcriptional regulator
MKFELTPDVAPWVEAGVADGRFASVEDAVRYAVNRTKQAELRDMLAATEAEGGGFTADEVRQHLRERRAARAAPQS